MINCMHTIGQLQMLEETLGKLTTECTAAVFEHTEMLASYTGYRGAKSVALR